MKEGPIILLQGQREKLAGLQEKERAKAGVIEAHKRTFPGDEVGLDKLWGELEAIREEIREITGEKKERQKPVSHAVPEMLAVDVDGATQESPALSSSPIGKKEEGEARAVKLFRGELAKHGISLDDIENLESLSFEQLVVLSGLCANLISHLEFDLSQKRANADANVDVTNAEEIINFLKKEQPKMETLLEETGIKENKRLPTAEYERLREEFRKAGMELDHWSYLDLPQLLAAEQILEEWEKKFPNNEEIVRRLASVNYYIREKEKEGIGNKTVILPPENLGWTPEDEEALKRALATKTEAETIIKTAQRRLAEIEKELEKESREEESEYAAYLKRSLDELREKLKKLKNTGKIKRFFLGIEDLEERLEREIRELEEDLLREVKYAEERKAREAEEREKKEAMKKDQEKNPFKYFLIGKMNDQAFRVLFGATKETVSLEDLNRIFGESGETLSFWDFKNISPINHDVVWATSNGFSLQLQNKEEVRGEENGKEVIMIYDPRAKYALVYPDWTTKNGETALSHEEGRRLMGQKAREYQELLLAEFKKH